MSHLRQTYATIVDVAMIIFIIGLVIYVLLVNHEVWDDLIEDWTQYPTERKKR